MAAAPDQSCKIRTKLIFVDALDGVPRGTGRNSEKFGIKVQIQALYIPENCLFSAKWLNCNSNFEFPALSAGALRPQRKKKKGRGMGNPTQNSTSSSRSSRLMVQRLFRTLNESRSSQSRLYSTLRPLMFSSTTATPKTRFSQKKDRDGLPARSEPGVRKKRETVAIRSRMGFSDRNRPARAFPNKTPAQRRKIAREMERQVPVAVKGEPSQPNRGVGPRTANRRVLHPVDRGWADWVHVHQQYWGWKAYLVTFLFNHLPGSERAQVGQMGRRIEGFYAALLTHMMHGPNRKVNLGRRPIMIAVPETCWRAMVQRFNLADVRPNGGWHYHAIFLVPPWTRKKAKPFDAFFAREYHRFVYPADELRRVHVERMDSKWAAVWSYITKAKGRNPNAQDDILLLPASVRTDAVAEIVAEQQAASAEKVAKLRAARLACEAKSGNVKARQKTWVPNRKIVRATRFDL